MSSSIDDNNNNKDSNSNSNNNSSKTVIIVGAGLAGLSLALGLAEQHHHHEEEDRDREQQRHDEEEPPKLKIIIVEKSHDFARTGATFGLQPNGKSALDELCEGVSEELTAKGVRIPESGGTMVGWWNVRDALLERVRNREHGNTCAATVTIHNGWMIGGISDDENEDFVEATFYKRRQEQQRHDEIDNNNNDKEKMTMTIKGHLVVGADGVNSTVRTLLNLSPAKDTGVTLWRTKLDIPLVDDNDDENENDNDNKKEKEEACKFLRPYLYSKSISPFGLRVHGSLNYMVFNFHEKIPGTMTLVINYKQQPSRQGGEENGSNNGCNDKDGKRHHHHYHAKTVLESHVHDPIELREIHALLQVANQDGLHHSVPLKVIELPLPTTRNGDDGDDDNCDSGWGGRGRITLIGDAAHGMRPASGQGGSMAFEDSVVLCRCLQKNHFFHNSNSNNNSKSAIEKMIRQDYENVRLPRVRRLWNDQWERSEAIYKNIIMEPWSSEFQQWVFQGV